MYGCSCTSKSVILPSKSVANEEGVVVVGRSERRETRRRAERREEPRGERGRDTRRERERATRGKQEREREGHQARERARESTPECDVAGCAHYIGAQEGARRSEEAE